MSLLLLLRSEPIIFLVNNTDLVNLVGHQLVHQNLVFHLRRDLIQWKDLESYINPDFSFLCFSSPPQVKVVVSWRRSNQANAINYLWRLSFHNIRQFPFIELEYERANSFGVI